jgi:subtilisin family serine protease
MSSAFAVPVAILDSGVDFQHVFIKSNLLAPVESSNGLDDDSNGLIDDIFGWNFSDKMATQLDRSTLPVTFPDYVRALGLLMKLGSRVSISQEDRQWLRDLWNGDDAENFRNNVEVTGQASHGTHVTGIIVRESNKTAETISLQIMPGVKFQALMAKAGEVAASTPSESDSATKTGLTTPEIIEVFKGWASENSDTWLEETKYLDQRNIRVANCSFGYSYKNALSIIPMLCEELNTNCEGREEELAMAFMQYFRAPDSARLIDTHAEGLFVIAAGNDIADNDVYPTEPSNHLAPNRISVAAVNRSITGLAVFSSYGKTTVDVAAPGELIESSYPNDLFNVMSGTSQASPFVAGVAAAILDINKSLRAVEVKEILMGTVDKKAWLSDKVVSGGMVNKNRALKAAVLSKSNSLFAAVAKANDQVDDLVYDTSMPKDFFPTKLEPGMKEFAEKLIRNSFGQF